MATLLIPFPDGARKLVLRGNRITIGRLPDNLIQIRDLTISGRHAELIFEGDHYRVHDLQSTNGVFADGQQVEDFHLQEACKLRLGTVECEFSATDETAENETAEPVPTHIEMRTLKQANGELKAQLEALREQNENMRKAREGQPASAPEGTVSIERYDQLAAELAALLASQPEQRTQMEALRTQLAVLTRERDNLQRAYDEARGALETTQTTGAAATPGQPPRATVAVAAAPVGLAAPVTSPAGAVPKPAPIAPRPPNGAPPPVTARPPTIPLAAEPIQAAPVAAAPAATPKPATDVPRAPLPSPKAPAAPPAALPRSASLFANLRPGAAVARSDNAQGAPLPKPPGALSGSTPTRRPPSGIQQPVAAPVAAKPATPTANLKETQKLEE